MLFDTFHQTIASVDIDPSGTVGEGRSMLVEAQE
jgi:hypothetical protein